MSANRATEHRILRDIRVELGQHPRVVLWRNESGVAVYPGGRVRYGLCRGSADLIGIMRGSGQFVALEVKTPQGKLTREQDMFLALVRQCGGIADVVSSVDEAYAAIGELPF